MTTVKEIKEAARGFGVLEKAFATLDHYRENGRPRGVSTGWPHFDQYFTFPPHGTLNIVSGIPGAGKSEFVDSIAANMALTKHWNIFSYSPENYPLDFQVEKLCEKFVGLPMLDAYNGVEKINNAEKDACYKILEDRFTFLAAKEENASIKSIMDGIKGKCLEKQVNMAVIDPWNSVEHSLPQNVLQSDWTGKLLDAIRNFARRRQIHFWIVAHPPKLKRKSNGDYPEVTPWDIHGSANFWNKADNLFILNRTWKQKRENDNITTCKIWKIKNRHYGKCGEHEFKFQPWCGRYVDG